MKFINTSIYDVILIEPDVINDSRGYFSETFRKDLLEKCVGYNTNFCQENESKSSYGVLRGLHYQLADYAQSKLVKVVSGKVLDIAVDIRLGSPTFGDYVGVELSSDNACQLFIPRGFAHGFIVLSADAIFSYKVDNYYSSVCERGIAFDDPVFNIDWRLSTDEIIVSDKDHAQPYLSETPDLFNFGDTLYL